MAELVAVFMAGIDAPLTAPATLPTITVRRIDTGAIVAGPSNMVNVGDGSYSFTFAPSATLEYTWRADGDPLVAGQTIAGGRFVFGSLSGITDARIEVDIPLILADTNAILVDTTQLLLDTAQLLIDVAAVPAATDVVLTAAHGAGAWTGTTPAAVATAVWSEPLPGAFPGGTAGFHLDAAISAVPAATDVVLTAAHGAGAWTSAVPPSVAAIVAGVWGEPLPGAFGAGTAGFHLDAPVSLVPAATDVVLSAAHGAGSWLSAVPPTVAAIVAGVWSEPVPGAFAGGSAGFILGTNLDATITGVPAAVDLVLSAAHGAGSWVGNPNRVNVGWARLDAANVEVTLSGVRNGADSPLLTAAITFFNSNGSVRFTTGGPGVPDAQGVIRFTFANALAVQASYWRATVTDATGAITTTGHVPFTF